MLLLGELSAFLLGGALATVGNLVPDDVAPLALVAGNTGGGAFRWSLRYPLLGCGPLGLLAC